MGKSNLVELPSQVQSHHPQPAQEENPLLKLRRRRAFALVPTVRPVHGGFRVSSSCRDIHYLVTQPNGHLVCTCPDFLRYDEQPDFKCKHVWAVEMAREDGRVSAPGNGHVPSDPVQLVPSHSLSVLHRYQSGEDPVRIKLTKNTKGYSWEISVAERHPDEALSVLQDLEEKVKIIFGEKDE